MPAPKPLAYQPRDDGGFGPKGSGSWGSGGTRSRRQGRNSALAGDEVTEADARGHEFSTGGYRPEEGTGKGPQFLVEADDVYDEEYGESRLVAPPVLGEAPPSFRDF
ncbi:hypothetical protein GIY23_02095 [Allosaccharopolyspora coralli]|uniref:Uncharacterized protein n=1 Tax=Allosaccharopolyspora coralli TaxID=2665642 RepID=A0A5Q3QA74_9PSEU|nr:hypothetical protein [Allosaccharopolyspora coralli]QGK68509.1 hypothetical protein GIY23_02095 [Allosaccharopolyspora coralli]